MNVDHWPKWLLNEIEWFQLKGNLEHADFHAKGNNILFNSLLKLCQMFSMIIWKDSDCNAKEIYIQFNNYDRTITYHLSSEEELNSVITPSVIKSLFQHAGILCIIDNNMHYKFEIDLEGTKCKGKVPWYNTTVYKKLNGQSLRDFFKQDRMTGVILCVLLMCITNSIYQCLVMQVVVVEYQYEVRRIKSTLLNWSHNHFIDNWLQLFDDNYQYRISINKMKMSELFETIPKTIPPKKGDDYKDNFQRTTRAVGG